MKHSPCRGAKAQQAHRRQMPEEWAVNQVAGVSPELQPGSIVLGASVKNLFIV